MNVLLFTNLFPTPSDPERGVFTLQIARQFNKHTNLTVVCPLPYFPDIKFLGRFKKWHALSQVPSEYMIDGIKVYSPKYLLIPKLSEGIHDRLMALSLKKFMHALHSKKNFDVINSKWLYPDACAIDHIFKDSGIPHVTAGLGSDINYEFKNPGKKQKILQMLNHADAAIVVSASLKEILVNAGVPDKKVNVIHNGVDTTHFTPRDQATTRTELGIDHNRKVIVYVGRLSPEKGIPTLIDALKQIVANNANPPQHLYLIGDGPLRESLEHQVTTLSLSEHVTFVGKIPHTDVSKWMGASDIFCLPSFNEGCPNVVLEALGSGRPVVASRVGAIPDIVSDDTGILFTAGNANELSAALIKANNTRWNTDVIVSSIKKLSWDETASKYMATFQRCIDARKT